MTVNNNDHRMSDENQPIIPSSTGTNTKPTSGEYDILQDKYDKLNKEYNLTLEEYEESTKKHKITKNELQEAANDNLELIKKVELLQELTEKT